ncbi:hypothetical protein EJB05_22233, partial [Eragrostis curvula]
MAFRQSCLHLPLHPWWTATPLCDAPRLQEFMPNTHHAGTTLLMYSVWPPVEVTVKESALPWSGERHCHLAPQFRIMGIQPVLVPFTDMDWMEPLPATLVMSTSWK